MNRAWNDAAPYFQILLSKTTPHREASSTDGERREKKERKRRSNTFF
jgi:hypothetical protein